MASASQTSGVVVWEYEERPNLWIPYEVGACQFLEKVFLEFKQGSSKKTSTVNLGNCSFGLSCYEVDLVNMQQLRLGTGTLRKIQRTVYPSGSAAGRGVRWEWFNDVIWVAYDIPTTEAIEQEYSAMRGFVDLSITPLAIPNYLDFHNMKQINKHTHFQRPVKRLTNQRYPLDTQGSSVTAKSPNIGLAASASLNGYTAFSHSRTPRARVTAGKAATAVSRRKNLKKVAVEHSQAAGATARDPLSEFCDDLETAPDEDCPICFEKLCNISSFDDESETTGEAQSSCIKQLTKCKHSFHASCLQAMYNSGAQDGSLQCPTCKAIHGVKHGNQPKDGVMDVHRSHRSLPGHPGCGMITIVYDFREGVQGPEHPNPGRRYSAGGFPRTCYLPDNQKGNKVLKLLKKAWQRRLIFTIGTSTTTGMQDTVIWNEIHHKTEAFSNHMGHGFPDPNYLDNVLAELAAQGVQDDEKSENLQE